MRNDLHNLFPDTVMHEKADSYSLHGEPAYAAPVPLAARVIRRQRTVVAKSGEVAISTAQIWLRDAAEIGLDDRFTLPDGTTDANILAIDGTPDETGDVYVKVYL